MRSPQAWFPLARCARESEQVHRTSARVCFCVGVCVVVGLVVGVGEGEGVHVVHEHERTMTCFVL